MSVGIGVLVGVFVAVGFRVGVFVAVGSGVLVGTSVLVSVGSGVFVGMLVGGMGVGSGSGVEQAEKSKKHNEISDKFGFIFMVPFLTRCNFGVISASCIITRRFLRCFSQKRRNFIKLCLVITHKEKGHVSPMPYARSNKK